MQIPNQRVFSLNSAVTPEIQWGTVSPSTNSGNVTLTSMPVGSMYVQQIGGSPITSCIVWVKTVSDIVAAQNLVNPWTAVSQASVADGATYPDFASDEFMAYQPGMIYIHNETKDTGTYRTAWLKVSDGGTRADWISIAESESLQRVVASIRKTGLTTDIVENANVIEWQEITTGTPTTEEEVPATAGIVRSDLRLNAPTDGLYDIRGTLVVTASTVALFYLGVSINGGVNDLHIINCHRSAASGKYILSGSTMVRLYKDDVVGLSVAAIAGVSTNTLTEFRLSIMLLAP